MKFSKQLLITSLIISSYTSYGQVNNVLFDIKNNNEYTMNTPQKNQSINLGNQNPNNWRITNDGVMGGSSKGYINIKKDHGLFTGNISLDNNGGFSALFTKIDLLHKNTEKVTVDIQGDGQTYQLRMIVYINGYRLSYNKPIETVKDIRHTMTFLLSDFKATYRGRSVPDAPKLTPMQIREVGFLITKKRVGPFSIAIYSISFD